MNCQNCGAEIRQQGKYCHNCGTPVEIDNISKGANFIRVAFVFIAVLPALQSVVGLAVSAIAFKKILPLQILDFFMILALFVFFSLLYRGKQWAITPIGLFIIFMGLLNLILAIFTYTVDPLFIARAIFGFIFIGFGFQFIRSKDVRAFVVQKSLNMISNAG